ncbi:MAG: hypothetical protein EPN91_08295 [Salinibacterium sp.]|nr:MAG: hypothetical protein EPN91_08295 [Salinibacterium sp.]
MPGPSAKVPEAAISSLDLVRKILASDASNHNKATMVQLFFDAHLNEELDVLIEFVQELEIDERDPRIQGPVCRGDLRAAVTACTAACRSAFISTLREHKRETE